MGTLGRYTIVEWLTGFHALADYRRDLAWRKQCASIDRGRRDRGRMKFRRGREHHGDNSGSRK
jgi:hypothetical protein